MILDMSVYMMMIFLIKMAELFANSGDLNQMPHSAVSDLGQQCLPITCLGVSSLQWFVIV